MYSKYTGRKMKSDKYDEYDPEDLQFEHGIKQGRKTDT